MKIIRTREHLQAYSDQQRAAGRRIALVPTMGALHAGHLSLVAIGQQHADEVWLSLFLNPTQFNNPSDFDAYPSTEERDLELCREAGVAVVWMPSGLRRLALRLKGGNFLHATSPFLVIDRFHVVFHAALEAEAAIHALEIVLGFRAARGGNLDFGSYP